VSNKNFASLSLTRTESPSFDESDSGLHSNPAQIRDVDFSSASDESG